jgi:type IV pilus assembly protein PilC
MLEGMIDRIAGYLERELALRRKFAGITFYPKILAVFIILAVIFIPHVGEIVDRGWPAVFLLLRSRVLLVVVFLVMLWAVIKLLLAVPPIRLVWDQVKISFPVLGPAMRKLAMSRFAMTLSVTYAAGIPLGQAVELSSDAMGNEVLRQSVLRSVPEVRAGGQLSEAFKRAGGMPDLVLGMVATGERTGSLDTVLDKVSEYYNSEAEATIEKSGYLLFVALIIAAGIAVAIIVAGFYQGYFRGLLR